MVAVNSCPALSASLDRLHLWGWWSLCTATEPLDTITYGGERKRFYLKFREELDDGSLISSQV